MVTEVSTFLIISQVSSGFQKKKCLFLSLANISSFMLRELVWGLVNSNISTMVYKITIRFAGMKALAVTNTTVYKLYIGSPRETDRVVRHS